jgi:hypothetical protein
MAETAVQSLPEGTPVNDTNDTHHFLDQQFSSTSAISQQYNNAPQTSGQSKGLKRTHSSDHVQTIIDNVAAGEYVSVTTKKSKKSKKSKQKQSLKTVPLQQFIRESSKPTSSNNCEKQAAVNDDSFNISELSELQFEKSCNTIGIQTDLSYSDGPTHSASFHLSGVDYNLSTTVSECISALIMPVSADVCSLQSQVHDLLIAVQQLSGQVEFLLSHSSPGYSSDKPTAQPVSDQLQHRNQHNMPADPNLLPVPTYSSVARQHIPKLCPTAPITVERRDMSPAGSVPSNLTNQPPIVSNDDLRRDVMTSVYIDLSLKEQKACNVVISGLASSQTDSEAVNELLHTEFDYNKSILRSRRIGKPSSDHIQPILVTLESKQDAKYLIENARQLRHSQSEVVRSQVYINADLTPTEARAAYELRCRRRARNQNQPHTSTSRVFYGSNQHSVEVSDPVNHDRPSTINLNIVHSDSDVVEHPSSVSAGRQ